MFRVNFCRNIIFGLHNAFYLLFGRTSYKALSIPDLHLIIGCIDVKPVPEDGYGISTASRPALGADRVYSRQLFVLDIRLVVVDPPGMELFARSAVRSTIRGRHDQVRYTCSRVD